MRETIYYSKIEFREYYADFRDIYRLLLDLDNRELVYQEYALKKNMPSASGIEVLEIDGYVHTFDCLFPMKSMKNGRTEFKPVMLKDNKTELIVTFSYGIKLSDDEYNALIPYCNALDFEPYRNRKMSMEDLGYIGYRDEIGMSFSAITDSYIPKLELPMSYHYDEEHIWPNEKLFRYLVQTFFAKSKKLQKCRICSYGGFSLFL